MTTEGSKLVRRSPIRLYWPFIALVLLQAAFITVAPSVGPDRRAVAGGASADVSAPPPLAGDDDVAAGFGSDPDTTGTNGAGATPLEGGSSGPSGEAGTSGDGPDPAAPGTGGGGTTPASQGDTSHCTPEGRQHGFYWLPEEAPVCVPKWPEGADNGGATAPKGVTADEVKIIFFEPIPNPAVDAVLASQGLAATDAEREQVRVAAEKFFNENYETYGRKLTFIRMQGQCPQTPPNVPACKAAARHVIDQNPFIVMFAQPIYPSVFQEFAREGIISIGGWHFDNDNFEGNFAGNRPYRWDVFMNGTETVRHIGEYYCKKLVNGTATHAGTLIHPQIGGRDTPRKLGIITPDTEANRGPAELLKRIVTDCGGPTPVISTYISDIERAETQARATAQKFISEGVTTVTCICDPIAPAYSTNAFTRNNYFPENLLAGSGLLDFDKLGRIYDQQQWRHAFGLSHLTDSRPFEHERVSRGFQAVGMGTPCGSCNLPWVYYDMASSLVMAAGPDLNPLTVERGVMNSEKRAGTRYLAGQVFEPGNYTSISDVREVYWSASAISPMDGRPGTYISLDEGRRYRLGQWDAEFRIPQPTA